MSAELDRLAAATLFPSFDGLVAPGWALDWLERGLGGVVLFARNVDEPLQLRELCAALRAVRDDVLVAIDEEGGDVTRLERRDGSSYPGSAALGAVDDVELTERVAAAIGNDLAHAGVNLDLAPVADLATDPESPIVGARSFGPAPELAARHVAAFVRGLQSAGVAACAKHFPGHGATHEDSHLELPTVDVDRDTLVARELVPFRAAIEAGVGAIMTAHVRVPALDDRPATVSKAILHGLLREELGFDGVVVADALEMQGLAATVGVEEGAVQALTAGADALIVGAELYEDAVERIHRAIVDAVRDGRLAEARVAEAAGRVRRLGLHFPGTAGTNGPSPPVGLEAARRAVRVEGQVRLARPPLVVELVTEPSIAAGQAGRGLAFELRSHDVVRLHDVPRGGTELLLRPDRQLVLVVRDAHRHEWQRETAELLIALAPDAVAVETGLPLWHAPARGRIDTHGTGRVNLEAAAELLLGILAVV